MFPRRMVFTESEREGGQFSEKEIWEKQYFGKQKMEIDATFKLLNPVGVLKQIKPGWEFYKRNIHKKILLSLILEIYLTSSTVKRWESIPVY